ncbi:hypothetical protein Glove_327g38 [Diversispora epigaea]|uniref:Protein kinase domain-containing protein n=1 Tax=Diversispora epigaea TaxID=1348612 RepID=A0A397HL78_9GLOM|nr:hypothetical protein Glove_327g38 [Diversispora epigaea]
MTTPCGIYTRSRDKELYICLSKPANETGISKDTPEVLSGDDNYSKASDIYGFAMIMFEILTGIPPFYNIPHDKDLVLKDLCWDAKSEQRPTED